MESNAVFESHFDIVDSGGQRGWYTYHYFEELMALFKFKWKCSVFRTSWIHNIKMGFENIVGFHRNCLYLFTSNMKKQPAIEYYIITDQLNVQTKYIFPQWLCNSISNKMTLSLPGLHSIQRNIGFSRPQMEIKFFWNLKIDPNQVPRKEEKKFQVSVLLHRHMHIGLPEFCKGMFFMIQKIFFQI